MRHSLVILAPVAGLVAERPDYDRREVFVALKHALHAVEVRLDTCPSTAMAR